MAIRFLDSIAHYNGTGIAEKWTSNSFANYNSTGGRRNSAYLSGVLSVSKTLTHQNTYIIGAAIALNTAGAGGRHLTLGNDGVNIAQVQVEADGTVSILSAGSRLANSSRAVSDYTSWHYYELSAIAGVAGGVLTLTATVRVDGLSFVTYSGTTSILTGNLIDSAATMNGCGINANTSLWFMDFYCLDTAGLDNYGNATTNTAFMGDVEIDAIFPAADTTAQWTQVGGTGTNHFTAVNENPPDFDTSYVSTTNTASSNKDAYTYQPITGFTGTILGAQYLTLARKDAEGIRVMAMTVGSNTATTIEFLGTSNYLSDYYVYYIAPLDSNFGVAWTTAAFGTGGQNFGIACIG